MFGDILHDLVANLPAIIIAGAALVKAFMSAADVKKLRAQVERLTEENQELKKQVDKLTDENSELREQNSVINAVNGELRRLLDGQKTQPVKRGLA